MGESRIRKMAALSAGLDGPGESLALDTFGGRLHVKFDDTASATVLSHLAHPSQRLLALRDWIRERLPPIANVVISNVPGPQVPLYLAGAQMKTFFPVSIITHGLAVNITVQTYCGSIDFGIIACSVAVPDLNDLGTAIEGGFDELVALAQAQAKAKVALDR